jgi:hypothetical protein
MIEAFGDCDFAFDNYSHSVSPLFVSELRCYRRNFFLVVYPDTKKDRRKGRPSSGRKSKERT